ncbi:LUD domain-containing protein [Natrinema salifodinae]|uniref:Iron-sulfur cluster-binding protein n=1 Tax=Natrinema salifodinae TaxID=1202768 RepID=A0A1I0QSW7_9EURY|nr:LUD domain-containing protein [Natrinema salifodinae]SEW30696.1 iron-sulfur cluster-binding protein [Natrinema salifodinae]
MAADRRRKAAHIRRLLETEGDSVEQNTLAFNEGRYEAVDDLEEYEALKDRATAIKDDAIDRLPELIDRVTETVEANGGTVYLAEDAADANAYVQRVVREREAETVVKSKSMTTEEIDLNEHLEAAGADVWETDLGEFVLQLAEEAPSHIVAPAIHKSREEIAQLFNERFDPDEPLETADELTAFARDVLGEHIEEADIGITGANFIAADTGTMALVTSEGNARKSVAVPDTHVAVAGVEKLVPTVRDIQPFIELIGRSGTGQDITSYISLLTPPVDTPPLPDADDAPIGDGGSIGGDDGGDRNGNPDSDREFHLVLLDNGRLAMRDDEQLRETLRCIRCSACLNSCPNFQQVGGHAFGGETYTGGIATGWETGVHGQESAAEFNDLCTGCTRCVNQCPVRIDIPWINTVVRNRVNNGADRSSFDHLVEGLVPDEEAPGYPLQKRFFGNYETVAKLGSATAPVSNWATALPGVRSAMERVIGVDDRRELPEFERESLVDWFRDRERTAPTDPDRRAVLYPDVYTNYVRVERGKAAVRALEALGVAVEIPDAPGSGRAPLSQGMIATAERTAESVAATLEPYVSDGYDVVVIEPSDLAMFRDDYEKLLAPDEYDPLSTNSYDLFEYVYGLLENGASIDRLRTAGGEGVGDEDTDGDDERRLAYHSHCQQRTLGLETYTEAVLDRAGYDVATSDVECCGMAGSFGYKSEYYELSMAVGERLRDQFTEPDVRDRAVVASGTSCQDQLSSLLADRPRHPIRVLDPGESR